jgi:hypothetical protein
MTDVVSSPCKRTGKITAKFNFMFTMLQSRRDVSVKSLMLASTLKSSLDSFLDALGKLRKTTISFVMSVRLSVRQHGKIGLPLDGFS